MTQKKEKSPTAAEIKWLKEKREMEREIEALKKAQTEVQQVKTESVQNHDTQHDKVIADLQAQISMLSRQVTGKDIPHKQKTLEDYFRPVEAEDILPDNKEVTYIARKVSYMIPSYVDANGVEKYPPHKIIVFKYAASDIRREGKEWNIKNFCQFNTRNKNEIEYLNNHPLFGITFSSDLNSMKDENIRDMEFKVMAANAIANLPPEEIVRRARELGVEDPRKSPGELKPLIIMKLAEQYLSAATAESAERVKRNVLAFTKQE